MNSNKIIWLWHHWKVIIISSNEILIEWADFRVRFRVDHGYNIITSMFELRMFYLWTLSRQSKKCDTTSQFEHYTCRFNDAVWLQSIFSANTIRIELCYKELFLYYTDVFLDINYPTKKLSTFFLGHKLKFHAWKLTIFYTGILQ